MNKYSHPLQRKGKLATRKKPSRSWSTWF